MGVLVLNGPNIGRLGVREPDTYGSSTYSDPVTRCDRTAEQLGLDVEVRQTDAEHEIISLLHEAADAGSPGVLDPAAPDAHVGGGATRAPCRRPR